MLEQTDIAVEVKGLAKYYGDVRALAPSVMRHRIILNFHAEAERVTTDDVIKRLLDEVPAPASDL